MSTYGQAGVHYGEPDGSYGDWAAKGRTTGGPAVWVPRKVIQGSGRLRARVLLSGTFKPLPAFDGTPVAVRAGGTLRVGHTSSRCRLRHRGTASVTASLRSTARMSGPARPLREHDDDSDLWHLLGLPDLT